MNKKASLTTDYFVKLVLVLMVVGVILAALLFKFFPDMQLIVDNLGFGL
jgi:hypothetical protein